MSSTTVIGMLLGIPESEQEKVRDFVDSGLRTEDGKPMDTSDERMLSGDFYADYVEWRSRNPSDHLMTALLTIEFEDERSWRSNPTSDVSWPTTHRYEPPAPHLVRYVTQDVEIHGQTVPAGGALMCLVGSANRDERRHPDPDVFDIHRTIGAHVTFGFGTHYCLGAALALLEGRAAPEEVLNGVPIKAGDLVYLCWASANFHDSTFEPLNVDSRPASLSE
jgi:cytochrome P450